MKSKNLILLGAIASTTANAAITIEFDYSLDSAAATPFFPSGSQARQTLEAAGTAVGSFLNDSLSAISPSVGNTWTAQYVHPVTGATVSVTDMSISANSVRIFVGARNLGAGVLGSAGPGLVNATGSSGFLSDSLHRGEDASGATFISSTSTDFGPWGGSASFSNTGTTWFFDPTASASVPVGNFDFYSVAVHEIFHVLGLGTSASWQHYLTISPPRFTGPTSVAVNGGPVSINTPDFAHWLDGKNHFLPGTATVQQTAMDPSIASATRKLPTVLDWAGLDDVGWDVAASRLTFVPEPVEVSLIGALGLVGFAVVRRRTSR